MRQDEIILNVRNLKSTILFMLAYFGGLYTFGQLTVLIFSFAVVKLSGCRKADVAKPLLGALSRLLEQRERAD